MEIKHQIKDDACFRYWTYPHLCGNKVMDFKTDDKLVITKEEFITCYKEWIEQEKEYDTNRHTHNGNSTDKGSRQS